MKKKGNKYIQKEVNTATPIEPYLELPSSQRKKGKWKSYQCIKLEKLVCFHFTTKSKRSSPKRKHSFIYLESIYFILKMIQLLHEIKGKHY